jgi:DNA-binding winged helix-turn-helix (wHTH) protein
MIFGKKSLDFFWTFSGFFLDFFWTVVESQRKRSFMISSNSKKTSEFYQFGVFRLDAIDHCLWREAKPIQLTPKQFNLLFYFVENAGRVAKKSELLDAVWADTFVEETTLARTISRLRQLLGDNADGEPIIETVPKLGYRFTAEVTRPDKNLLIVEEETVQYTRGEEIITFDNEATEAIFNQKSESKTVIVPSKAARFRQSFITPVIIILTLAVSIIAGIGLVNLNLQSKADELSKKTNKPIKSIDLSDKSAIKIGSIINLQNRYPNDGSYLDAWGMVWSKPEFKKVPTETMFVSTHNNPDRDNGSGSWEIVAANGKSNGEPLVVGDQIHLKNMYPNAGYLDVCGWTEHLPVFDKFLDQTGAVFTTRSPDRDNGTGIWIVRSATEEDRTPVLEGDSIAIESSYFINDGGKNRVSGFLNVAGKVKDIPSFNDYDGSRLVFTQNISYDQPVLDIWTITISIADLK